MYEVRAKSQMQNLSAGRRESLDEAVSLAEKLQSASPNRFFEYFVRDAAGTQVWPV